MTSASLSNPVIHEMTTGEMISRAWRLYRLNFSNLIIYNILPTVIIAFGHLLMQSSQLFMDHNNPNPALMGLFCFLYPVGMVLSFAGLIVSVYFNVCLVKAIFNIILGKKADFKSIMNYTKVRYASIVKLCLLLIGEIIVFGLFDGIILFSSFIILIIPIAVLSSALHGNDTFICILFSIFFFIFMMIVLIYFVLFLVQFLFCFLQIHMVIVDNVKVFDSLLKAFEFLRRRLLSAMWFSFCLYFLWYILYLFSIMIIGGIAGAIIAIMLKESNQTPIYILVFLTFSGSFITMVFWPFVVASISLFYYDAKSRLEGFDLKLALNSTSLIE